MQAAIDMPPVLVDWLNESELYQRAFDKDIATVTADVIRRWMSNALSPYCTIPCRDCGEVHSKLGDGRRWQCDPPEYKGVKSEKPCK